MANQWFRMYAEFATDPKVQMMSEAYQRRLTMLFCLRCSNEELLHDEEIAFQLRITNDEWLQTKQAFIDKKFIDKTNALLNWDKRQFVSDSSAERVQKYRANRKALGLSSNGYTKHSVTVMRRDNNQCVYCGSEENLCIDHIYPINQGGNDDIENLATACKACNSGKAGRTPEQARYSFLNKKTESIWNDWVIKNSVTVTVTPPDTDTDTDTDIYKSNKLDLLSKVALQDDPFSKKKEVEEESNVVELKKPTKKPTPPYQKIVDLFHEVLPDLGEVYKLNETRKRHIAALCKEELTELDHWRNYFKHVSKSDFLMGRVHDPTGRRWQASIDFLINPTNFIKISEDKYHAKAKVPQRRRI